MALKIYLLGHARSAKDHAGEYLKKKIGMNFESSSYFLAKKFIFDALRGEFGYKTVDECFEDRHNHRKRWYGMITAYNTPDRTRLSSAIFDEFDAYIGLRNYEELEAAKKKWGRAVLVIWIDAEERVGPESEDSCTVTVDQADIIIKNNGTVEEFDAKLAKLAVILAGRF